MFNVESKTDSLVYRSTACTKRTKRLMEKLKRKRKPLSSSESVKAVQWKRWGLWREGFMEKVSFESRVEDSGVVDGDSGDGSE